MKFSKTSIIVVLIIVMFFLVGSSISYSANEPIKVGVVAQLSGATSINGELTVKALKAAIEVINKQGGVIDGRNFELKVLDNEGNPDVNNRQVKELVQKEGYSLIVTDGTTACIAALQNIASELDAVIIDGSAMSTPLRDKDHRQENVFLASMPVDAVLKALVERIVEDGYTGMKWGGLNPDYGFGHDSWDSFTKYMKKMDPTATFVDSVYFPFKGNNLVPYIQRAMVSDPDGIFTSAFAGDVFNLLKQGTPRGLFKGKILTTYDIFEVIKSGGARYLPDTIISSDREGWMVNPEFPASRKEYQDTYMELFGEKPIYHQSCAYDSIFVLAEVIRKIHSTDYKEIISALNGLEYSGSLGISFVRESDHQIVYPFVPTYKVVSSPDEEVPYWINAPYGGFKVIDAIGIEGTF
jgi:branched-chain amino acid transport system substrate-binding protein